MGGKPRDAVMTPRGPGGVVPGDVTPPSRTVIRATGLALVARDAGDSEREDLALLDQRQRGGPAGPAPPGPPPTGAPRATGRGGRRPEAGG
jgi:hypothetical protein